MRQILRRHEVVTDDWRHSSEEDSASASGVIIPLAELLRDTPAWEARGARLGARLAPADRVEELAPLLSKLSLVAIEFPNPGDGRGFSQARILRTRYRFGGELRAVGAGVKRDLVFLMARSGIDAFELAPGEDFESAFQALRRYTVAYQPGAPHPSIQRQRYSL